MLPMLLGCCCCCCCCVIRPQRKFSKARTKRPHTTKPLLCTLLSSLSIHAPYFGCGFLQHSFKLFGEEAQNREEVWLQFHNRALFCPHEHFHVPCALRRFNIRTVALSLTHSRFKCFLNWNVCVCVSCARFVFTQNEERWWRIYQTNKCPKTVIAACGSCKSDMQVYVYVAFGVFVFVCVCVVCIEIWHHRAARVHHRAPGVSKRDRKLYMHTIVSNCCSERWPSSAPDAR